MKRNYFNLTTFSVFCFILLLFAITIDVLLLLSNSIDLFIIKNNSLKLMEEDIIYLVLGLVKLITLMGFFIFFLINIIIIMCIFYALSYNCRFINNGTIENSPGWTIAYFLIPIISFFKPYVALKEIYSISNNELTKYSTKNNIHIIWWLLYLIKGISLRFVSDIENINLITLNIVVLINLSYYFVTYLVFKQIFRLNYNLLEEKIMKDKATNIL